MLECFRRKFLFLKEPLGGAGVYTPPSEEGDQSESTASVRPSGFSGRVLRGDAGRKRLVFLLPLQALNLLAVAVDFRLVTVDLLLLLVVGILVALQLIANQRAGAQTQSAADRRAGARTAHRRSR